METDRDILFWLKGIGTKFDFKLKLTYKNISLWWFCEPTLTRLVGNLIRNKKYESSQNMFIKYVTKLPRFYYFYFLARTLVRFVLGKLLTSKPQGDKSACKILAVSYIAFWRDYPVAGRGDKHIDRDAILGNVITTLRNRNFNVVALDQDSSLLTDFRTRIKKRQFGKPVESYLTLGAVKNAIKAGRRSEKEWDRLKCNNEFVDSLCYSGIPLFALLKDDLAKTFCRNTFIATLSIELVRRAIKTEEPDLLLITFEDGTLGKAAVFAGKLEGIPTLAIQHGNISPYHIGYLHTKEEVSDEIAPENFPLPDKTAVYGPWVKRVLIKHGYYPAYSVVVTGQAKYDMLARADESFRRENFCKRHGLDPDKKIVLVCTQPSIAEKRIIFLKSILRVPKEFPKVQIVIKPHPQEKRNWHKGVVKEQGAEALVLPRSSNTYEAIYACDAMLAFVSTTITEALILNKFVVVVNLTGRPDLMPYVESGAALGAHREEDIIPAIRDVLYNEEVRKRLTEVRKEFIYQHTYIQDGKASERVVDLITQMAEESRRR